MQLLTRWLRPGLAPEKWRVPLEVKGELDDEAATVHEGI